MHVRQFRAARRCAGVPLIAALAGPLPAAAHAIAGARVFPVMVNIDDPGVADEASIPTVSYQRSGAEGGPGPVQQVDLGFEYDKRVTRNFGVGINDDVQVADTEHDKTRTGWGDISVTAKYQAFVNAPHEAIMSVGIVREFARTGTAHTGADQYGYTQANIYGGKGMGDIPVDALRPFAVTGEFGFALADKELKALAPAPMAGAAQNAPLAAINFNNGFANSWSGGFSVQYSVPYLVSQVRDFDAPPFFKHLIPLVEVAWSSPASSPSDGGTQIVVAPGVIYLGHWYQVALEALIPANKASGTNVGVVTQFHVFLDDLLPHSLGKPIFD